MSAIIFQTADPVRYRRMLEATSRTAIEFCRRHGHRYESYLGIKRGFHGWQASFNRIFQFLELIERGYRGWALYMDADAYIHDLDFDLDGYLSDKGDRAAIMSTIPGADQPWHINSGVIFVNLGSPVAQRLLAEWKAKYMTLSDERLMAETAMQEFDNDQHMLSEVLGSDAALHEAVHYEAPALINAIDGSFIRQHLRAYLPDVEERTRSIEVLVENVVGPREKESPTHLVAPAIVAAIYRTLLHRDPDPEGLRTYSDKIRLEGAERGTQNLLGLMLDSEEHRNLSR